MVIPQWPNVIYLIETFKEGLRIEVKMVITSMPHKTLMEVAKLISLIEEEMPIRRNNMAIYWQTFNNEKSKEFNHEYYQNPIRRNLKYNSILTLKMYFQNYYNEGHFMECTLLSKICQICENSDHNTNKCPNKTTTIGYP